MRAVHKNEIPAFLPGRLIVARGTAKDYRALSNFHYLAPRPATWAGVWVVRYSDPVRSVSRPVAVAVLSYPAPSCTARDVALKRTGFSRLENLRFANRHVRTISRVIVHPQFRALGLSTLLVRVLLRKCRTRYVEAIAAMGRVHPFFERAGMKRIDLAGKYRPAYFFFDRRVSSCRAQAEANSGGNP